MRFACAAKRSETLLLVFCIEMLPRGFISVSLFEPAEPEPDAGESASRSTIPLAAGAVVDDDEDDDEVAAVACSGLTHLSPQCLPSHLA